MNQASNQDPLQFLKSLWGPMGVPMPGMVTPTVDLGEVEKRIADLKSVENWLKMNLSMLQMNIQGLEMQKATLSAIQQGMGQKPADAVAATNPMVEAWWNAMQAMTPQGVDAGKEKK